MILQILITCPVAVHQMFFATSVLHVHLMQWDDENLVEQAVNRCDHVWESIDPNKVSAIFIVVCYFYQLSIRRIALERDLGPVLLCSQDNSFDREFLENGMKFWEHTQFHWLFYVLCSLKSLKQRYFRLVVF